MPFVIIQVGAFYVFDFKLAFAFWYAVSVWLMLAQQVQDDKLFLGQRVFWQGVGEAYVIKIVFGVAVVEAKAVKRLAVKKEPLKSAVV